MPRIRPFARSNGRKCRCRLSDNLFRAAKKSIRAALFLLAAAISRTRRVRPDVPFAPLGDVNDIISIQSGELKKEE